MRLQVFHIFTDLDYFYIRRTCKTFLIDYAFAVKYNLISPCLFVPSIACKTLKEAVRKVHESPFRLCGANRLTAGTSIRAPSTSSGGASYSGKNRTINENGSYNITFDDGDQREKFTIEWNDIGFENPNRVTAIVLGQGFQVVEESTDEDCHSVNFLIIQCPVNIVGSRDVLNKSTIIVMSVFDVNGYGNVHVEHLTMRQSKDCGVFGWSSVTLNDRIIEQCGGFFYSCKM
jgi:hypothetical protein